MRAAEKYRRIKAGQALTGTYKDGFLSAGLFALSRHPNFFSEQVTSCQWWLGVCAAIRAVASHG